jgi:hypothetical protein
VGLNKGDFDMPSENENTMDYGAFLADLEARRAALDNAITALKAWLSSAPGSSEGMSYVKLGTTVMNPSIHGGEVPSGAFLGKSIPEATKLYLSIVKQKRSTREIADALRKGGMESTSNNFEGIVATGLHRASKNIGEIVRVTGAWALAEWYPSGMRLSKGKADGKKKPSLKARLKAYKKSKAKAAEESLQPKLLTDGGPQAAVERFFTGRRGREFSRKDVAESLGMKVQTVGLIVGKLVHRGVLEKTENGMFRAR